MSTSFPVGGVRVRCAGETHIGMRRQHNEDALSLPAGERLCIVADGMGGHASGEIASRLTVDTMVEYFQTTDEDRAPTWPFPLDSGPSRHRKRLGAAIRLANLRILEESRSNVRYQGMGTTVVAAYFSDAGAIFAHVGDSRIYRLRDGTLDQITEDHSLYTEYMSLRSSHSDDTGPFPQKNVLVRALGMRESVQVDTRQEAMRLGDLYLMCTDGLSGMISNEIIQEQLTVARDLDRTCDNLIEAANRAGGNDNITVALARIEPV